jgi:hypothetical protein
MSVVLTDLAGPSSSVSGSISDGSVTLAKLADLATDTFIGRDTAGTGVPEALSVATVKTMLGVDTGAALVADADSTMAADSDLRVATQKATKAAIAAAVVGLWDLKTAVDCSANPNYPAASKSDAYPVSVAGKIGGASGVSVDVGDVVIASADNAGGTEAAVGTSWFVLEHNLVGVLLAANNLSDLTNAVTARTNLGLGNVDNTSDVNKAVSTAATAAFAPIAHVGAGGTAHANAVAGGAAGFLTGADKTKLDGLSAPGLVLLSTYTPSGAATVDIETTIDSTYDHYIVDFHSVVGSADGANIVAQYKIAGAYVTTGTYLSHRDRSMSTTTEDTIDTVISSTGTSIIINSNVGNAAGESMAGEIHLYNPASTTMKKIMTAEGGALDAAASAICRVSVVGTNTGTGAVTGLRIFATSGTITGTFNLYGVKK